MSRPRTRRHALSVAAATALAALTLSVPAALAQSGPPIKVGVGLALTGAGAAPGKILQATLEIWRDDVNAKGGLLGRPVELIYYDDQSNPANVPGIYTKLISVDKVDLLLGPYATNFVAPAMPVIMQNNKMTISLTAIGINDHFKYPKYFTMTPSGPEGIASFAIGFFNLAAQQTPKPQTVAIIAADAEFARNTSDGARAQAKKHGFKIVYDRSYPPPTTDFTPMVRAIQAANPDIVYVAAYPPDTVGIVRAANEVGLVPKMFGGAMIGLLVTPIKVQLGPLANGIVIGEVFVPAPSMMAFPGVADVIRRYQEKAKGAGLDPLGYSFVPFGYAAGQVLADAVTATKSLDHDKLAEHLRKTTFNTVAGEVRFGPDGEWAKSRQLFTQFQNLTPNDVNQFRDGAKQPILWPPELKSGTMIYPFAEARKK